MRLPFFTADSEYPPIWRHGLVIFGGIHILYRKSGCFSINELPPPLRFDPDFGVVRYVGFLFAGLRLFFRLWSAVVRLCAPPRSFSVDHAKTPPRPFRRKFRCSPIRRYRRIS